MCLQLLFPAFSDLPNKGQAINKAHLTVQCSLHQNFSAPVNVTGEVALSELSGYYQVTDPATNWPADPANPGAKARPWYRVTWCFDATDCTNAAKSVSSTPAQPVDWFHFGTFETPSEGNTVVVRLAWGFSCGG
jgi:hypothetical protein